ncbi:MAG: hypothetical protein NT058_00605, partial [Candidatus Portnoybacteria bacterium]|nr:hypothetical protein [Candidatus Portnoybacteria bacterium]
DIDYLSEMLNNWSKGTVSENDFTSDKCTGIDENGKKVNLLGENNVIDMSNAKWTAYLGSGSSQSYGNISLKANSIVSGQINITITNTDTGENKTVSLKAGESVDLLGKKISVVEFKRENNIDRATVTVE